MNLDQVTQRDRRIAELEALGRARRTANEQDELGRLLKCQYDHWNRLPEQRAGMLRRAREIEAYARQIGLPLQAGAP